MEALRTLARADISHPGRAAHVPTRSGADFKTTLNQMRAGGENVAIHEELLTLRDKMLSGHRFTAQELLLYQVRAGEFNLRVELLSRAAESALSTARRFQNQ